LSHPTTILQDKNTPEIGNIFTHLATVDSSNNYAMAQVHDGKAFHGNVFFAYEQTAGKGQRGKQWMAHAGANIMMSIVLQPEPLFITEQFMLSTCITLGCYDLLNIYSPGKIFIKWPNDLYIGDRKAGGILIENIISGTSWKYAIAGIGININQTEFDKNLPNPVSLTQATGKTFDVIGLAKELCVFVDKRYQELGLVKTDEMMVEYNQHLYKRNKLVRLKRENEIFETIVKEVTAQGRLITIDDEKRSFDFGEVEWQF
jgi:BirA family biotin operon repressor/biotin-[acetyl-CoA-carboxylase] ligase